jgi:hypothetical protein
MNCLGKAQVGRDCVREAIKNLREQLNNSRKSVDEKVIEVLEYLNEYFPDFNIEREAVVKFINYGTTFMTKYYMMIIMTTCLFACQNNSSNKPNDSKNTNDTYEEFKAFINRFYSDTIFQKSRIIIPLEGEILEWNEKDIVVKSDWNNRKINVTNYETILKYKPNAKHSIEKGKETCTEKILIENSGFLMERKFILSERKWFLKEYKISNL